MFSHRHPLPPYARPGHARIVRLCTRIAAARARARRPARTRTMRSAGARQRSSPAAAVRARTQAVWPSGPTPRHSARAAACGSSSHRRAARLVGHRRLGLDGSPCVTATTCLPRHCHASSSRPWSAACMTARASPRAAGKGRRARTPRPLALAAAAATAAALRPQRPAALALQGPSRWRFHVPTIVAAATAARTLVLVPFHACAAAAPYAPSAAPDSRQPGRVAEQLARLDSRKRTRHLRRPEHAHRLRRAASGAPLSPP